MNEAYQAALTSAAVFDRSTVGKLSLIGPDAVPFLHNLCTNDIKSLKVGEGCEAYLCDPRAKVLHQFWSYRVEKGLWLETVTGRNTELFKALDRYLISEQVEITDRTLEYVQFHVAGPTAKRAVDVVNSEIPELNIFQFIEKEYGQIRRRDVLGITGYDVLTDLTGHNDALIEGYRHARAVPGDAATYETLRVEAGSPEYGKDIDETRFVMEVARAERAVSFTKGCFPGQEPIVMARDRAGFVNRAFLGMKVLEGGPIAHGTKLTANGVEVGIITSSVLSPRLNAPLALGYVKRGHQERGTKLQAGDQPVELLGFPPLAGI